MKNLALILSAGLAGAVVVVACSDDSPHDVDAATCDCPAGEPPITSARIHRVESAMSTISVGTSGGASAACPAGEVLVTGGCTVLVDSGGLGLLDSLPVDPINWTCTWRNSGTSDAQVRAIVNCLRPTP